MRLSFRILSIGILALISAVEERDPVKLMTRKILLFSLLLMSTSCYALAQDTESVVEFSSTERAKIVQRLNEETAIMKAEIDRQKTKKEFEELRRERARAIIPEADSKVLEDHGYDIQGELYQPQVMVYRSLEIASDRLSEKVYKELLRRQEDKRPTRIIVADSADGTRDLLTLYYYTEIVLFDIASTYYHIVNPKDKSNPKAAFAAPEGINLALDVLTGTALNVADLFAVFRQKIELKAVDVKLDPSATRFAVASALRRKIGPSLGVIGITTLDGAFPIRHSAPTSISFELDRDDFLKAFTAAQIEQKIYTILRLRGEASGKAEPLRTELEKNLEVKSDFEKAEKELADAKLANEVAKKALAKDPKNPELKKAAAESQKLEETKNEAFQNAEAKWKPDLQKETEKLERKLASFLRLNKAVDELVAELGKNGMLGKLMALEGALLTAPDDTGNIARTTQANLKRVAIVSVSPVFAGADQRLVSNLFNSGSLSFSSGVVLKYLISSVDGELFSSGVIHEITGYQRTRDRGGRYPD